MPARVSSLTQFDPAQAWQQLERGTAAGLGVEVVLGLSWR